MSTDGTEKVMKMRTGAPIGWIFGLFHGMKNPTERVSFEKKVVVDGNTKRIDVYIPWKRIDSLLKSAILLVGNPTMLGGDFMEAVKDYDVHIDSKKRVTLRGAKYQYYNVREYENGCIMLEPRELITPEEISSKTLASMDQAIRNFKLGQVSNPVDLSDF